GRLGTPVGNAFRVELERPELARERPYRQDTFPRALEQPVIALGAPRVVAADIDDVSPGDQSFLCAHARSGTWARHRFDHGHGGMPGRDGSRQAKAGLLEQTGIIL